MLVLLLGVVGALTGVVPAQAHTELAGSDPAAGSTVQQLPPVVTLTFDDNILEQAGATVVQVKDSSGTSYATGQPRIAGKVVTQPLAGAPSGTMTVSWKVVSDDGHPISSQYSFTVAPATPSPSPSPAVNTPVASPATPSVPAAAPSTAAVDTKTGSGGAAPWIIAAVVALAVIAGVVTALARRRRAGAGTSGNSPKGQA